MADRREDSIAPTCRQETIRLAKRIVALDGELTENRKALDAAVEETAPELCELPGVGSVVAACVLTAWSHPGRVRSEAAFAALAGTCPIPASSGNTLRHRLNRGDDRRLNRALTTVVIVRSAPTHQRVPTSPDAARKAGPPKRSCAPSSATSPDRSSGLSPQHIPSL
jgi:transposase